MEAFIACLRRLVSCHGKPQVIWCDNGTNQFIIETYSNLVLFWDQRGRNNIYIYIYNVHLFSLLIFQPEQVHAGNYIVCGYTVL